MLYTQPSVKTIEAMNNAVAPLGLDKKDSPLHYNWAYGDVDFDLSAINPDNAVQFVLQTIHQHGKEHGRAWLKLEFKQLLDIK